MERWILRGRLTTKFLLASVLLFSILIIVLNIKIYYDFKEFYVNQEISKIHDNLENILKSDTKYRIYYSFWTKNLDYNSFINDLKDKLTSGIISIELYTYKGELIYSSKDCSKIDRTSKLNKALNGETLYNIFTKDQEKLLEIYKVFSDKTTYIHEIYLPVKQDSKVLGVIVIYRLGEKLQKDILSARKRATIITIVGFFLYVFLLYNIVVMVEYQENKLSEKLKNMEKLSTLGQFASKMAHEIGTPLSVIKGTVEIMGEVCECVRSKEIVDTVDRQINKINNIIKNYLYASKRPEPQSIKINLKDMVDQIVKEMVLVVNDNITITADTYDYFITTDPVLVEQIIVNIIKNSCDAIGSNPGQIRVFFKEDENFIYINVQDNGPGIPENIRDKIFDPFFSTKKSGKGTGLGLAVCKELIESLNGVLRFESSKSGTRFIIGLKK